MSDILTHMAPWIDSIPETREDWLTKVMELKSLHRGAGWKLAYWVAWGFGQYPDLTVEDLAIQLNRDEQTIRNYRSIMRNPAADLAQRLGLSVSHAVEVQGLPDKEEWLKKATEGLWSCARLRAELRDSRLQSVAAVGNSQEKDCVICRAQGKDVMATYLNHGEWRCEEHKRFPPSNNEAPEPAPHDPSPEPEDYKYTEAFDYPDDDDEPPYCRQEIDIDIPEPAKAFEIAEYIVEKWGQTMAREVVEELARWW